MNVLATLRKIMNCEGDAAAQILLEKLVLQVAAQHPDLQAENLRLRAALERIAERTGSDDPCRPLVEIARDALRQEN